MTEEYEFDSDENECDDEEGDEAEIAQPPAAKKARVDEHNEEAKQPPSEPEATLTLQVRIPGGRPLVVTAGSRERVGTVVERVCQQTAARDGKELDSRNLVLYTAYPRAALAAATTLGDAGIKDRTLLVLEHKAP